MKVLLIAIGTRGDIEPFLAMAELLVKNNEKVICCFPEQFREITTACGFPFAPLSAEFLETLDSKEGIIAMGGKANFIEKIKAYFILYKRSIRVSKIMCSQQKELIDNVKPDKIIYHIKACYPMLYEVEHPTKTILLSPIPYMVHPTEAHAHIGFKNMGSFINKLSYKLANYGLSNNIKTVSKGLFNPKLINTKKILSALAQTKTVYTISPFLFNRSKSWSNKVRILGYHERNKALHWTPSNELLEFIKTHKGIALITFGSMVNEAPKEKTEMIVRVLKKLKIPAIISAGYGGLIALENNTSSTIHYVSNIPYDWLLPQIDFMMHHGGSGTTHMAMKYACPSVIIPHIIDQFLWNEINHERGLGPKGVSIRKLNEKVLEVLLHDLISNTRYKENAQIASKAIQAEDYKEELIDFIKN